jgi:acetyltransferase
VRYRFFSALRELSAERMARLTQMDYEREIAFIAIRPATGDTVGVARLVRESSAVAGQGDSGEFAIAVQPDAKGRGLGSALMGCLFGWARGQGMTRIVGQVLADNAPMLAFVRHLGFTIRRIPRESDVVEAVLELESQHG